MRCSRSSHLLMCFSLETLTFIVRTGSPFLVELIDLVNSYNFSVSNDLTQMVNFCTQISDSDSHSPVLLDLFFLLTKVFVLQWLSPPLRNSDHVVVSVSNDFVINPKQDAPFHYIAYDYSHAHWDGHHDHLRDASWEDIFKPGASTATS